MSNYGPPLISKKMEKNWPSQPNPEWLVKQFHMKDIVETSLFISLFTKFYGAEWVNENPITDLKGILAPYITEYEDPVEAVRRIRESDEYED